MFRISSNSTVFIITLCIVMLLLPLTLGAQSTTARLSGTVWDPSDNPTPGVILTAVEENTGWQSEAVSDENGRYIFLSLRPGFYTVFTKARGYQQITRRRIYLPINGNITESFTLDIATADETVAIEEPMPLDSSDSYADISRKDIDALPMYDRNSLVLAAHEPGIQANGGSEEASTSNGARIGMNRPSIDGLEITDPLTPLLGQSSVPLNTESIESIHVITSGATAEFGGSAGAQLGAISRIGGKAWHGSVFDYLSNESLNANDFFRSTAGLGRTNYRRNIFGGTLSGPIGNNRTLIFGHYEGSRMGDEIRRNRLVLTDDGDDDEDDANEGLNDEAKAGVFRWYTPGDNPSNDEVEINTYNIVDSPDDINPLIAETLAMLPSPNNTLIGDGLNTAGYSFDNEIHGNSDQASVRIDHTLSSNHSLYLRMNWYKSDFTDIRNYADAPFPGTPEGTIENTTWAIFAGSQFTLNPRMINELRIGYVRPKMELNRPARLPQSMWTSNSWTDPLNTDSPRVYISPFFELSDTFTHHSNRHTFKYGGSFRRTVRESTDYNGLYPDITFGTSYGNAPAEVGPMGNDVISDADRQTFEYLYNDLLGRIESISRTYYYDMSSFQSNDSPRERSYASFELSGFVQDDWRIRPNLTLNLGIRYEFFSVPNEKNDLQLVLDPLSEISATSNYSDFSLTPGNEWRNRTLSNFAPRAGFAWDISGYGTFVLRGSYGIYYDRIPGGITNLIDRNTYGLSQKVTTYPNSEGGDLRLGDAALPYPAVPATAPDWTLPSTRSTSIVILDPDLGTPRIERFNLTMERRMSDHLIFEVSYIGARGKNLYQNLNYNQTKTQNGFLQDFQELKAFRDDGTPVSASNTLVRIFGSAINAWEAIGADIFGISYVDSGQAGAAADVVDRNFYAQYAAADVSDYYLRNFPQFNQFIVGTDTGRSWYDSMRIGFRANSASFRMRGFYTWGKSLDTLSVDGTAFFSPSDSRNPLANKAPSDFDRSHIINLTSSFNIPVGRNRRWGSESSQIMDWIFGDWEVGFISLWESGQRFSVTSGLQTLYANVESLANYDGSRGIGEVQFTPNGIYYFNTDEIYSFSSPEAGEYGSSGRNSFKGPQYFNVDMTFFKHFKIGDNNSVQIRGEVYNLFNKTHFGIPVNRLSSTAFGMFTTTIGTPRAAQVAVRYSF